MSDSDRVWKKCSSCKKPILFGAPYWVCNVSTCTRKRTGLSFCSVSCWDAHVPMMNHRESWAIEERAPTAAEWKLILEEEAKPRTRKPKEEVAPVEEAPKPMSSGPKVILRRTPKSE